MIRKTKKGPRRLREMPVAWSYVENGGFSFPSTDYYRFMQIIARYYEEHL